MFNNHVQLLLVLSLVVIVAIILYNGARVIQGCRELGTRSLTASLSDQLWEKIGSVRGRITELKAQFDAFAGRREIWEDTVGAHIRNAVDAVTKFNPAQALQSYQYAEELARDCVNRLACPQQA